MVSPIARRRKTSALQNFRKKRENSPLRQEQITKNIFSCQNRKNILEGIEFSPARQRWVSVCDEALVLFEVGGHVQGNRGVPLDLAVEGGGDGLTRGW